MPTPKSNPILSQPIEVRLWLEAKMKEELTDEEIYTLLCEKFPHIKGIEEKHIAFYRKKFVPDYQKKILERHETQLDEPEAAIEKQILDEVKLAEEAGEEFNKDEQEKINMLKAYRAVLKEMWTNYNGIRTSDDEQNKRGYLVELLKALKEIRELESAEKSFLSAMDEVRKAEQKLTPEQCADSIKGWWVPRLIEKVPSKEQAQIALDDLRAYLDMFKDVVAKAGSTQEANTEILAKLYVKKKFKENEVPAKNE